VDENSKDLVAVAPLARDKPREGVTGAEVVLEKSMELAANPG
jgi:hypothetical protein